MPNIKSAKKRVKVTQVKSLQNQIAKSELKTIIKKFDTISATDKGAAEEVFRTAVKKIDCAAANGILHKNTAARKKSALALKLNAIK
ncbi:MAG: 30S ribosomal protein S20 [Clostridiales bacterium]|nr:30S ribosomal protein S20 [Clostridiales bacterium]